MYKYFIFSLFSKEWALIQFEGDFPCSNLNVYEFRRQFYITGETFWPTQLFLGKQLIFPKNESKFSNSYKLPPEFYLSQCFGVKAELNV